MIKKSLIWSYRVAYTALGTFVFLSLLSIIVLRYLILPHIDDYKPKIVQGLSKILGQKVTIGNIYANWDSLNPHLSIFNVDIYDKENRIALSLRHIEGSLSWTTIPLFEPRLSSFAIYQPELTVRREKNGTIYVAGVSMNGPSHPEFPNWLLRQGEVNVVDANIIWQDDLRGAPPLNLNKLNLELKNPAWDSLRGHHEFSLQATPSAATSKPIEIRGKVFGKDVSQIEYWHGTVYAKIEGTDIAAWRNWLNYPFDLREGHGAAQFWVDFADNQIENLTADVSLDKVITHLPYNNLENSFNRIAGRIKWIHHRDGQEIQGEGIKIVTSDDLNMRSGKFSVRERKNKENKYLEGNILLDEIQLETLSKLTPYFTLPNVAEQTLKATEPLGKLSNLKLSWISKDESLSEYALSADFKGLSIHPYSKYSVPGFTNLTGKIVLNQNQGKLKLDSDSATLNFTPVLRWPIPTQKITGQIDWKIKDQNINIDFNSIDVKSEHFTGEVNASYTSDGTQKQYLDLTGHAKNVELKYGRFYYPSTLSKDTLAWLDKSILSGHANDANVRIKGNLKDFPFSDGKKGIFRVTADINDATLDYTDGWPKIEGIQLGLLFEGKRMELNASTGHLFGNEIKKTKITIPDLEVNDNVLDVVGETQGPVSEAIKFINSSPISKLANGFTENLKTTGMGKLNLTLHIPLNNNEASKVKGTFIVTNGSMLADSIPELTKVNGTVDFTESSINANNINTWAYGGPAFFSINTDKNHGIQIAAQGRVTDAGLRKSFSNLTPGTLSGSTEWFAKAQIMNKQSEVSIRSNLIGIGLQLPAPFGKAVSDATPLLIEKKPISETQDAIKVSLGSAIAAKFIRTSQNGISRIDRGDIGINVVPEISNQKGISLHANLESLDIDEWLAQLNQSSNNTPSAVTIDRIDLTTSHLDLFDRRINSLRLNAKSVDNAWIMNLKSNEINGDLKWSQDGNGKISGNLTNLVFPSPTPDVVKNPTNAVAKQLNIKYPALDIAADNFEINKKKLGRMELQAKEQFGNWGIEKLRLTTTDGVINANGEWNNWKKQPNTKLRFNWEISDMGKALKRLDFGEVMKGGTGEITGQLKWAGSPHEFNIPNLSGNLHLDAKKGQIVQVEPGVGRLFSVLSLQNLPRRLTLDFKDLFSSGFTFDKITADVNIERGIMFSDNFKMDGPTAKVEIKGETDLDKETQHLFIKAKPYISDTLSLAAFAGGPAVGAAAFIAQKILKDPLNKIAETQYEIVGTWNDPQEKDSKNSSSNNSSLPLGK